jgi:predicted enzyme related to lactoylglutathione lyase
LRADTIEMKLEVIVMPVSDVDRAKRFYGSLKPVRKKVESSESVVIL